MEPLLPLRPQLVRQINLLSSSTTRLSLMSVVIPSLSRQAVVSAILSAATAADLVGMLPDGSIGVFALRAPGPDGGAGVDERFLPRLQASLRQAFTPAFAGDIKIWFRSIHRWSVEIGDADDLMDGLFAASARVVGVMPMVPPPMLRPLPIRRERQHPPVIW